jgi:acetyl-CoA carboxylase biotin carboxyl carrier protein
MEVELKQIKELMIAMERSGTRRLVLKEKQFELVLEREEKDQLDGSYSSNYQSLEGIGEGENTYDRANQALSRGAEMPTALAAAASKNEPIDKNQFFITSPMVGTFYSGPSPEDPPFIKVGDKIEKDTLVCVIEAMKVMNEVKAGISGTVVEVLTDNAHPVEFGTKLFRVQ